MALVLNTLVHLVSLMMYGFTLFYAFTILHIPMIGKRFEKFDPGQFKYLTMWDVFVGVTFWALMFVDRELVLPKALDPYFPWWLNHLMHTMIMVTTVFEMMVAPRRYPKRSRGLGILVGFMLVYLIWMHVIYYKSGIWVYPVMEVLTQPLRILFFAVLLTFCTILYFVGETLNNIVWGNEHTKHKKSHAKSK
ncbi:androgen-induced gene 1 protein isoform X3 [Polyergus mexicanus]|uniref:androgen-induced gene 1 protein isoform X3 n=1 Tax=Polyergus mexicanus TaxID=615972 RepID=UPI0038B61851